MPTSLDTKLLLHALERDARGLGRRRQYTDKLHSLHYREEQERSRRGAFSKTGKYRRDHGIHDPVSETPEALALGPHQIRKYFAEVDPDHGALGEREKSNEAHQQPHQQIFMLARREDCGY